VPNGNNPAPKESLHNGVTPAAVHAGTLTAVDSRDSGRAARRPSVHAWRNTSGDRAITQSRAAASHPAAPAGDVAVSSVEGLAANARRPFTQMSIDRRNFPRRDPRMADRRA